MTNATTGSEAIAGRLVQVEARGRISDALLSVAVDALQPFASDYLPADEFARLCELVRGPVSAATEASLSTLTSELSAVTDAVDPRHVSHLAGLARCE